MQYIVDDRGVKTSVIVPFGEWEEILSDKLKLQNKLKVICWKTLYWGNQLDRIPTKSGLQSKVKEKEKVEGYEQ